MSNYLIIWIAGALIFATLILLNYKITIKNRMGFLSIILIVWHCENQYGDGVYIFPTIMVVVLWPVTISLVILLLAFIWLEEKILNPED